MNGYLIRREIGRRKCQANYAVIVRIIMPSIDQQTSGPAFVVTHEVLYPVYLLGVTVEMCRRGVYIYIYNTIDTEVLHGPI